MKQKYISTSPALNYHSFHTHTKISNIQLQQHTLYNTLGHTKVCVSVCVWHEGQGQLTPGLTQHSKSAGATHIVRQCVKVMDIYNSNKENI